MRVFINPGHDRKYDSGACNPDLGLREADIAYDIGTRVAEYLDDAGCEVRVMQSDNLCNDSDYHNRKEAVCDAANDWNADLFISIHCNAFNGTARGTEVEVFRLNGAAQRLARCILRQIVSSLGTVARNVNARPALKVLKHTTMPAVLVETAFIDNWSDAILLRDRADDFARAIARGVTDYLQEQY